MNTHCRTAASAESLSAEGSSTSATISTLLSGQRMTVLAAKRQQIVEVIRNRTSTKE